MRSPKQGKSDENDFELELNYKKPVVKNSGFKIINSTKTKNSGNDALASVP